MTNLERAFIDMYVAMAKLRRHADGYESDWDRWVARVKLAERLGEHELARLARRRALLAAEQEVKLRAYLESNADRLEYVRDLTR